MGLYCWLSGDPLEHGEFGGSFRGPLWSWRFSLITARPPLAERQPHQVFPPRQLQSFRGDRLKEEKERGGTRRTRERDEGKPGRVKRKKLKAQGSSGGSESLPACNKQTEIDKGREREEGTWPDDHLSTCLWIGKIKQKRESTGPLKGGKARSRRNHRGDRGRTESHLSRYFSVQKDDDRLYDGRQGSTVLWGGGHWQKGEAVGSKPLKTSFSEALSCSEVAWSGCTGLLPPKGLPVPPVLAACFTTLYREDTGRLWTPAGPCSPAAPGAP
ncbi:hypothetical protein EYF80_013002 [Liparis tanakae]|uniref:Uncharacterized protein n=1 Tax=Liparis tanakae TaxID=230148 RepID=A0A4Z2IHT6_9TELE|nr:hypothetical protein EYF80_013002 [Liparis tanakae]